MLNSNFKKFIQFLNALDYKGDLKLTPRLHPNQNATSPVLDYSS